MTKFGKTLWLSAAAALILAPAGSTLAQSDPIQEGSVGIEARIPSDPPTEAPIITIPRNGQSFSQLPITVAGVCTNGLLVEIFRNGVFAGAEDCSGGSFSLQIDLFDGRNDIIARHYDSLNQQGPDSATVSVTYSGATARTGPKVSVTSAFAKRGAAPGSTLSWPLSISGGTGPYAVSVDWGDNSPADLISRTGPGDFIVEHVYGQAGTYNVVIKVTDANNESSYLQVVGVGNGPIQQSGQEGQASSQRQDPERVILWWPLILALLLSVVAFWLGQKHQLQVIRDRLRKGERPFK